MDNAKPETSTVRELMDEVARLKGENGRLKGKHFKSTVHNQMSALYLKHDDSRIATLTARNAELVEAVKPLINGPVRYDGKDIVIMCRSHDDAVSIILTARKALEASHE